MVIVLLIIPPLQSWRRSPFNFNKPRFPNRLKLQPLQITDYDYYPKQPQRSLALDSTYYLTHGLANPLQNPFYLQQEIPVSQRNGFHDPNEVTIEHEILNIRHQFQPCLNHCPHLDHRGGPCSNHCGNKNIFFDNFFKNLYLSFHYLIGRFGHCCRFNVVSNYPNSCNGTVNWIFLNFF